MIKLSDYVTRFLVEKGVHDIFLVSGGGIMHLVDSVGRQEGLSYICNHHEQACAIAAESYARRRGHVGACLVTTGPGGTNALSAIPGAFVDSVPVFVLSGQVRRDLIADYHRLRQYGPQEINIIDMARPVVKYAATVMDPLEIHRELERAWTLATTGRPGPVWINIPLDVQGAMIDEALLLPPDPPAAQPLLPPLDLEPILALLAQAKRPLWVLGNGIHVGNAYAQMRDLLERSGIPAILTIGGLDLLEEEHPLNMGRFGPVGQRRANFALQTADLLMAVGASLSVASIGFNTEGFAPNAKKVSVNLDAAELDKPNLKLDLGIHAEAGDFMAAMATALELAPIGPFPRWLEACTDWKQRYPTLVPDYYQDLGHVNTYVMAEALSRELGPGGTMITGNSLDIVSVYQSFQAKRGQRIYTNINYGAMGWDLPAAVGACVASGRGRTILFTGDGSIQLNLQELLTIKQYQLDIKIFVINNQGYESIRSTQRNYFESRFVGSDPATGIGNPDYARLAEAYGFTYERIGTNDEIPARLGPFLSRPGPGLCELVASYDQPRSPRVTSVRREDGRMESRPLEDMFPFLPPDEVAANMWISHGDPVE